MTAATAAARRSIRDELDEYTYLSNQMNVEYVDAVQEPTQAQQYEVQSLPTILFEYAGRTERTSSSDEQALTNALKKVVARPGEEGLLPAGSRRARHVGVRRERLQQRDGRAEEGQLRSSDAERWRRPARFRTMRA